MTMMSGRPRGQSHQNSSTRSRKRDRIRSAFDQKTMGVAAIATLGAVAAGAIGVLGFRKIDADRRNADPNAKPLADEIRNRASSAASEVVDRASHFASDIRDRATATVHEIGTRAGAIKNDVVGRTRLGDPEPEAETASSQIPIEAEDRRDAVGAA